MARALRIEKGGAFYHLTSLLDKSQIYCRMEKGRKENKKMDLLIAEIEKMCNVKI